MKIIKRTPIKCPNCEGSGSTQNRKCCSCNGKGVLHELYLSNAVNLEEIVSFEKMTEDKKLFPMND